MADGNQMWSPLQICSENVPPVLTAHGLHSPRHTPSTGRDHPTTTGSVGYSGTTEDFSVRQHSSRCGSLMRTPGQTPSAETRPDMPGTLGRLDNSIGRQLQARLDNTELEMMELRRRLAQTEQRTGTISGRTTSPSHAGSAFVPSRQTSMMPLAQMSVGSGPGSPPQMTPSPAQSSSDQGMANYWINVEVPVALQVSAEQLAESVQEAVERLLLTVQQQQQPIFRLVGSIGSATDSRLSDPVRRGAVHVYSSPLQGMPTQLPSRPVPEPTAPRTVRGSLSSNPSARGADTKSVRFSDADNSTALPPRGSPPQRVEEVGVLTGLTYSAGQAAFAHPPAVGAVPSPPAQVQTAPRCSPRTRKLAGASVSSAPGAPPSPGRQQQEDGVDRRSSAPAGAAPAAAPAAPEQAGSSGAPGGGRSSPSARKSRQEPKRYRFRIPGGGLKLPGARPAGDNALEPSPPLQAHDAEHPRRHSARVPDDEERRSSISSVDSSRRGIGLDGYPRRGSNNSLDRARRAAKSTDAHPGAADDEERRGSMGSEGRRSSLGASGQNSPGLLRPRSAVTPGAVTVNDTPESVFMLLHGNSQPSPAYVAGGGSAAQGVTAPGAGAGE